VKFIGLIPHEELPRLYKISDIYVLPSITRGENFGNSALEAMACGTPVIASNLPGVRELVTDESGIKVEPKDISSLASSINKLLDDSNMRKQMGIAARKNADKYSWVDVAQRFLKIYEDLLKTKS
jgi:glycosyltransferase involved in cell wall biosynthesis